MFYSFLKGGGFMTCLTQDLKNKLFDLLYNDEDSWYAELYPRVDSEKLQLALPILSEYLKTEDLHHVDSLVAHTLATFAEQCSFRNKVNPYPCDAFLWNDNGIFTKYLNENPNFFYEFMQLFKNGKKYDGWNELFRKSYIEKSLENLSNAESDEGVDLQYIIAYYFADILSYENGVAMLKEDTKFVKNIVWDIYEGFSQTVCNSHKSQLLSDYCGDSDLGILFERIDHKATEGILNILN
jgi:hypothetical protein